MNPYVRRFAIANFALTLIGAVLAELLKVNSGSALAIGATLASSFFAAGAFAKDHGRAPTREENGAFAWRALAVTWLISLVLVAAVMALFVPGSEIGAIARLMKSGKALALAFGVILFVSAIYYAGIRWSFGWFAKTVAKRRA